MIRISGKGTKEIVSQIFTPKKASFPLQDRKVCFGEITAKGECLDEVLLWLFSAPHSYTGEEMAEISCHGSPYIQQQMLELLIQKGCRMARPGEFTQRAFINGKWICPRRKRWPTSSPPTQKHRTNWLSAS